MTQTCLSLQIGTTKNQKWFLIAPMSNRTQPECQKNILLPKKVS